MPGGSLYCFIFVYVENFPKKKFKKIRDDASKALSTMFSIKYALNK